jgi:purine catabolism regulator
MSLTVRQILTIPELAEASLIAGEPGLDKQVTSVNVMEAPDIAYWLRGGEMLLSSGYQFRDNVDGLEELVITLNSKGAAALGFKNRFVQEFPPKAVRIANEIGFPILNLPVGLPYSDIIRIVMLGSDEVENIRFSESVMRSFSEILTEGGGITRILQNLSSFLKCGSAFLDSSTGETFFSSKESFGDFPDNWDNKKPLEKFHKEDLSLFQRKYGCFIFERSPQPQEGLWHIVFGHAKSATLLALQRDIAAKQVEAQYRNEFVQDLVYGNIRHREEVLNRARRYGWNLIGKMRCLVFDIDDFKSHFSLPIPDARAAKLEDTKELIYSVCKNTVNPVFGNAPYLTMSNSIVFILNTEGSSNFRTKLEACCDSTREKTRELTGFSLTIGLGDEKEDFSGIKESYAEARRGIEMMRPLNGNGKLYIWDELGVYAILAPVAQSEDTMKFFSTRMSRLIGSDDLMRTLHVLVEKDWNFKAAARVLDIHYNTIHYRYERICELSKLDLSSGERRLELAVALKLLYLNPKLADTKNQDRLKNG